MKKIWIITIFPEYSKPYLEFGVVAKFLKKSKDFEINIVDLAKYSGKDFKGIDDSPYGGGPGMVIRADVLKSALIDGVVVPGGYGDDFKSKLEVIYTGPRGKTWENSFCKEFANDFFVKGSKDLVFICGRYEGIDERFFENYVDQEISIGDFVLTGGELAVMMILDSSMRFVPGVLGNSDSALSESFNDSLLDHQHFTRPSNFEGKEVPSVLLSGHHANIEKFRMKERERLTEKYRPDLKEKK